MKKVEASIAGISALSPKAFGVQIHFSTVTFVFTEFAMKHSVWAK
jgi:hypothetical protein